ncbi:hypothetical protein [Rhizobium sp. BK176]|uniref:hypothetical protein n=1 Tax=Rhizobium sp. BK176 TaxID=2587071 RepID=UPI0021675DF3|nr:hypothetical protein [Rhizobium sp. BK176]MCS4090124.1 hypothetical protein [Rhizobium sp. BK176]
MSSHREPHDAFLDAFTGRDTATSRSVFDHTFDRFLSMIYGGATVETFEVSDEAPEPLILDRKALDWTDFRRVPGTDYVTAEKQGAIVAFRRKPFVQRVAEAVELFSGGTTDVDVVAVVHNGRFLISPAAETPDLVDALIERHLSSFNGFIGTGVKADRSEVDVLLRAHRRAVGAAIEIGLPVSKHVQADYQSEAEMDRIAIVPGDRQMFVRFNPAINGARC